MVVCESGMPTFDFQVRSPLQVLIPRRLWLAQAASAHRARSTMLAPSQALPFGDVREMDEAWHAVAGYPPAVPRRWARCWPTMTIMFALRCAASPDSFFFGPTKELLRTSACRLRVRRNVARLRRCAHWTGRIACWYNVQACKKASMCSWWSGICCRPSRVPCPFLMRLSFHPGLVAVIERAEVSASIHRVRWLRAAAAAAAAAAAHILIVWGVVWYVVCQTTFDS